MAFTVAKLHKDGNMDLNREIIEVEAVWDDTISNDEESLFEDEVSFDDEDRVENIVNLLFDAEHAWQNIDHFHLRYNDENFYTSNFIEDSTSGHPMKLEKNGGVIIKGIVIENAM